MLNQIPDKRDPIELEDGIYYGAGQSSVVDHEIDLGKDEVAAPHESIDMEQRRKSSVSSSKSGSESSIELPKRSSTVEAGKSLLLILSSTESLRQRILSMKLFIFFF